MQPQLAKYCSKFDEFTQYEWSILLLKHPELIEYYGNRNILKRSDKINLLLEHSRLIGKLHIKGIDVNFVRILYNSREHNANLMNIYIKKYKDKEVLTNMIGIYPDLKKFYTKKDLWKYVDFNQLSNNLEYSILK